MERTMNSTAGEISFDHTKKIKFRYELLKAEEPYICAHNAAEELGISEGELLASQVGSGTTRLIDDAKKILKSLLPIGELMALTRNKSCIHEHKVVYDNLKISRHNNMTTGLFANPDINLRLFMNHWRYNFATVDQTHGNAHKSLQFFDHKGQGIHKIYLTPKSNEAAYDTLVDKLAHSQQDSEIDWPDSRNTWETPKGTFSPRIGQGSAHGVDNCAARQVLELARDSECEIMVFTGNHGCLQIHTGPVNKLLDHGRSYHVLDPMFNLHLLEDRITQTWVMKKKTKTGIVTSLEMLDERNEIIAAFFGKDKPGIPELELWREIIAAIPAKEITHVT